MLAQKREFTLHGDLIRVADFLAKTNTKQKDHINDMSQLRARDPSEVLASPKRRFVVHLMSALRTVADTQRLGLQVTLPTRFHPKRTHRGPAIPLRALPLSNKLHRHDCVGQGASPLSSWMGE